MTRVLRLYLWGAARCRDHTARRLRRARSQAPAGDPGRRGPSLQPLSLGVPDRGSSRATTPEDRFNSPAADLVCGKAERPRQRGHVSVRLAMWEMGMPAIPRPQENEGVGEHVRIKFHVGPKAGCEIAEPLGRRTAPNEENLFLLPDRSLASEPAKDDDPTVDLMSRRHPLSSTRTF